MSHVNNRSSLQQSGSEIVFVSAIDATDNSTFPLQHSQNCRDLLFQQDALSAFVMKTAHFETSPHQTAAFLNFSSSNGSVLKLLPHQTEAFSSCLPLAPRARNSPGQLVRQFVASSARLLAFIKCFFSLPLVAACTQRVADCVVLKNVFNTRTR